MLPSRWTCCFIRSRRAEIKRRIGTKPCGGVLADKKLVARPDLSERLCLMHSLQLLSETYLFGILIHPWKIVGLTGTLVFGLRFVIQWIASRSEERRVGKDGMS